ncbi:MAG: hypothetical protein BRC49_06795 [Cyanobacteria bacterium SW_10_48_33]|nr:MAG: hypothetical protein BRC45_16325 [Cyanobacteria bacterium QS_5_48_63]PSO83751.1 MAG: hypothetical protein BRC43_17595 [Cyanobacteria bacterium QS_3_48_167]PSO90051.1 MAG: hypothetical protein BRC46_14465 [Cyanobacteria bacterium QS_6_48_18]PSP11881.1 MAG: hypothetical protein BRC49_06795 [Cyanobacteria bacterium SW_10_48_33]PSP16448.1 MAG: hypothetical protein BRC52_14735 [Cyanobacteria bacterium SW_5_48_44]
MRELGSRGAGQKTTHPSPPHLLTPHSLTCFTRNSSVLTFPPISTKMYLEKLQTPVNPLHRGTSVENTSGSAITQGV